MEDNPKHNRKFYAVCNISPIRAHHLHHSSLLVEIYGAEKEKRNHSFSSGRIKDEINRQTLHLKNKRTR